MQEAESDLAALTASVIAEGKFPLGMLFCTPGIIAAVSSTEMNSALSRHAKGDWGDLDADDKKANDDSLVNGSRLLSAYHTEAGLKFWIITEADRSSTTVLLPSEY